MSSCQTNNNLKEKKHNKIRKRGNCSSTPSSSSSSLARRYRFKRAILVANIPTRTKSPSIMAMHHHHHHAAQSHLTKTALPSSGSGLPSKEKELSVSARKLAATLWEINDLPPSRVKKEPMRSNKETIRDRAASLCRSGLLGPPHMSDTSYSPFSERMKGFEIDGCKRRVSALSHQLQLDLRGLDAPCSADLMEKVSNKPPKDKKNWDKCTVGVNRLKEARSGLSTSKKLLKVLSQMCLQEQHSSSIPLILAMRSELDRVRNQIDQLIQEHSPNPNDIEYLMKHFAEEKNAWKRREREKIRNATMSIAQELEIEKKLRRQRERLNEKIAKEMANVKASHSKVSKELEREKRAKEILEQICDELAKGIGEDRAQVEEMKKESAKVREEVEKERKMLQLAEVLREERVHMKLSEAKYQFEEKNAVLEKLRHELERFFRSKEGKNGVDVNPEFEKIKGHLESCLKKTFWGFQDLEGVEHEDDDSAESDLQSIELNMDNDNKSYKWSYACENVACDDNTKRVSVEKDNMGRKSFSERIQWGSICFNKGTANDTKKRDLVDRERSIEFLFGDQIQKGENEETECYRPIMSLRDYMSCPDPAQENGQRSLTLRCIDGEAGENALELEGHDLKQEAAQRK